MDRARIERAALLAAQRDERIDPRRPARRHVAGEKATTSRNTATATKLNGSNGLTL